MTDARETAFADWLEEVAGDREIGFAPSLLPAGARHWYRSVFDDHGAVPVPYLPELVFERTRSLARTALALLGAAAERDLGVRLDLTVEAGPYDDHAPCGEVRVYSEQVRDLGLQEVLVTVASGVQDFVADVHRRAWPVCPEHRLGVHPAVVGDRAVWRCGAGPHHLPLPGGDGRA